MSKFVCPVCGEEHAGAVATVGIYDVRQIAALPSMTIAEFTVAHPEYRTIVNNARQPAAIQLRANGEPGLTIMATLADEVLHPDNFPVRREDGMWITVGGEFRLLGRVVQEFEQSRETPAARFFVGRTTVGLDPLLIDALIRPFNGTVADAVVARNAALETATETAKQTNAEDDQQAAREAEISAMAPPFPAIEWEEIEWPKGKKLKVPIEFMFSDGTVKTALEFAQEENIRHRARLGI